MLIALYKICSYGACWMWGVGSGIGKKSLSWRGEDRHHKRDIPKEQDFKIYSFSGRLFFFSEI